jgi:hypothetical protein
MNGGGPASLEHEPGRASSPGRATARGEVVVPGRSTRSALLQASEPVTPTGAVQRKAVAPAGDGAGGPAGQPAKPGAGDVHALAAQGISGAATALPFRDRIQRLFGRHDVGGIQAHVGGPASQACRDMGAKAFATGNHVAFRDAPDLHTAAHEAAHVVQQRAGVHVAGGVGEAGDDYERSADRVADAVVAGQSAEALLDGAGGGGPSAAQAGGSKPAAAPGAAHPPAGAGSLQAKAEAANDHAPCSQCGEGGCACPGSSQPAAGSPAAAGGAHVVQKSAELSTVQLDGGATATPTPLPAPAGCDGTFCQPFATRQDAINDKNLKWSVLRIGISAKVSGKVLTLWDQWAAGGTAVQDISKDFAADFTSSPTTADTTRYLLDQIRTAVAARPPLAAGATATVSLAALIPTAVAAIDDPNGANQMNFNIIGDIPGNIAGGIGKDQAANPVGAMPSPQNDARLVDGNVVITGLPGGGQRVTPQLNFTVLDTLDLCPGNCGASIEQIATVPMSRWEATGIAGDVPYTVHFAPPAGLTAPFDVLPAGVVATPTPTPGPSGGNSR